jgi:hypothetical protein
MTTTHPIRDGYLLSTTNSVLMAATVLLTGGRAACLFITTTLTALVLVEKWLRILRDPGQK